MRPTGSGPLSALLVLAPLVALPILAVVGIPQFAGGNLIDSQSSSAKSISRSGSRVNESRSGDAATSDADDLFAPLGKNPNGFDDPLRPSKKKSRSRAAQSTDTEFGTDENGLDEFDGVQDSETGNRSRGRSRGAPGIRNTADLDSDESDADSDFGSDTKNRSGSRTRGRNQTRESDFNNDSDVSLQPDGQDTPTGKQYADSSLDSQTSARSNGRQLKSSRSDEVDREDSAGPRANDENLFEESGSNKEIRNTTKSALGNRPPTPRSRPRGPNDAPVFDPQSDLPNRSSKVEASELEEQDTLPRRQSNPGAKSAREEFEGNSETPAPSASKVTPAPAVNSQQEMTLKSMFDRLQTLGMTPESHYFTYLEDSESFLFTCTAGRPGSSTPPRKFEDEAADPMLAVLKVLKQVQVWQAKKSKPVRSN